jgi:beta-N-acetylhexosaminidase
LVPFRAVFNAGIGSVMIAHLSVPSIDNTPNKATSISKNNVTGLLRDSLHYNGLTFTDALEMKGVAKYFPGGTIAVEALIAGNDMLCLPASVPETIEAVKKAIAEKRLSWDDINSKVKKVLLAKYNLGLNQWNPIDTTNLLTDLNKSTDSIRTEVAKKSITVIKNEDKWYSPIKDSRLAYIGIGSAQLNSFGTRVKQDKKADVFLFSYKDDASRERILLDSIWKGNYGGLIIDISGYNLRPGNNYSISNTALDLWKQLQSYQNINFVFGNVLASKNFCAAKNLVACYQDDDITQQVAADVLEGSLMPKGHLPITVCNFKYGTGIVQPTGLAVSLGKFYQVDSIVADALDKDAFPGCVVLAAKNGTIIYQKAFGHYDFDPRSTVMNTKNIFDLASVTKVSATTISVMKLYEQGKIKLNKTLGDYLPWTKGTDKANLKIEDVLLHQAGLVPFIPFYKETIDSLTGIPKPDLYSDKEIPGFNIHVAENLYLRNDWEDTIFQRILKSPLGPSKKYVYSDNDFIFLGRIVQAVSGMPLDEYVRKTFYGPMELATTGFKPLERFPVARIIPTENEKHFRRQHLWGYVHDEGSSLFGGVAGHAGLFSDAEDLSKLYQMLLNGGKYNGTRYLKEKTIKFFTAYHSEVSRRGYGFDKPEKDNATSKEPYPSELASPLTFGHTGYTGTCVWVDPTYKIVYIFLSNRVNPTRNNNKISQMFIRGKIQDAFYRALGI